MPLWRNGAGRWDAEDCDELDATAKPAAEREERFRVALLNGIEDLVRALGQVVDAIDRGTPS